MPKHDTETIDLGQSCTEGLSKYGEVESVLVLNLEKGSPIESKYRIDVPEEILWFCREIRSLGGRALIVGGSVRDKIIATEIEGRQIESKDFDVEVYGIQAEDLIRVVRANYEVKENRDLVGKSFQVLNIYSPILKYPINVSLPREDSKVAEGHKGFVSTGRPDFTIKEAAQRRDITINSAAYDPLTHELFDPYDAIGAVTRQVIEVTDETKFIEDPLRVMRIMQFGARFPEFDIPEKTVEFCRGMVVRGELDHLSKNRIKDEVEKMIVKGEKPSRGMIFALQVGIVERYWPEFHNLVDLYQDQEWHPEIYVWEHTLQVMDAAALIARRENLDDKQRKILMYAAMCHDLAKLETFDIMAEYEGDKLIRSRIVTRGHEEKGGPLTREFLKKFSPKDQPNAGIALEDREAIVALVESHLKPKFFWQEAMDGKNMTRAVRRWSYKLSLKNTNWYMLSLLAEADQRGRNGDGNTPLEREVVDDLVTWQLWLAEISVAQKVILDAPNPICTSDMVRKLAPEKKSGPWVGVIIRCVYEDELDLLVTNPLEAQIRAKMYFEKLMSKVLEVAGEDEGRHRVLWDAMKHTPDPRYYVD